MSKAEFKQLVHKIIQDTNLLLQVVHKISEETSADDFDPDDDVVTRNGTKYYYHPPEKNDSVEILWQLTDEEHKWYGGTIQSVRKYEKKIIFTIEYDNGTRSRDYLDIKHFPEKWRFKQDVVNGPSQSSLLERV